MSIDSYLSGQYTLGRELKPSTVRTYYALNGKLPSGVPIRDLEEGVDYLIIETPVEPIFQIRATRALAELRKALVENTKDEEPSKLTRRETLEKRRYVFMKNNNLRRNGMRNVT